MAIFKPKQTEYSNENNKFLGICNFAIMGFTDKSDMFDWADLYIEVEVKQEFSDYTRKLQIKGSYEKENGKIVGGTVLKRLYNFLDAVGQEVGLNVEGGWEDSKGKEIEDIAKHLNDNCLAEADADYNPASYPYIAYFYKEQPKKNGDKSYTTVYPKVYRSTQENNAKLKNDIDWLKGKGYLKELTDVVVNSPAMSESGLANL